MDLDGKTFRVVSNSSGAALNSQTRMTFAEDAEGLTAIYSGGTIRTGNVIAQWTGKDKLLMLYQCITTLDELKAGQAWARFGTNAEGGTTMHLDWQWLTGNRSTGVSDWILEE